MSETEDIDPSDPSIISIVESQKRLFYHSMKIQTSNK